MNLNLPKSFTCLILLFILNSSLVNGQTGEGVRKDTIATEQKDIVDILQGGFKTHLRKDTVSVNGKGPFISILPVVGYSLQSGLTGAIVTNTSFYTDDRKSRFSNLLVNGYYSQYHQYWFTANSSIFLEKYKIHLVGDSRYYNFPTETFGLGTNSSLADGLDVKYSYLRISQMVYRELAPNLFAGAGYNLDYHWNIASDTTSGKALDDLRKYQKGSSSVSSGISLNL